MITITDQSTDFSVQYDLFGVDSVYVTATSDVGDVYYQWYMNGGILDGETNSTYTVQDPATYYCIVSDDDIESETPTNDIVVTSTPVLLQVSTSGLNTFAVGDNSQLFYEWGSYLAPSYQWYKDDIAISAGQTYDYTLGNAQTNWSFTSAFIGTYHCVVDNVDGGQKISPDFIVGALTTIVTDLDGLTHSYDSGSEINLEISATGYNLSYQWYHDNDVIEGAESASYTINSFSQSNVGDYYCKVTGDYDFVDSNFVTLELNAETITTIRNTTISII